MFRCSADEEDSAVILPSRICCYCCSEFCSCLLVVDAQAVVLVLECKIESDS
ncbi:hypothetical protein Acr_09g0000530 [Actinidia rufa]|uniref:Uncharacterized protein n=1 Tax=Actinidia rufa TaxID=165716 RepID=A0A7J0F6S5_9ERIC|nr:hypothetical protein Acr_09g0000530 [Actinidia rufa]